MADIEKAPHASATKHEKPAALATVQSRLSGLKAGLKAPWVGVSILAKNPATWPYALVPAFVFLTIVSTLSTIGIAYIPGLVRAIVGGGSAWYEVAGAVALQVLATVSGVVVSLVVGFAFTQPISGRALDRIVRTVEAELGAAERPRVPLWKEIGRSALGVSIGLSAGLPVLALLFIIGLVVPGAWVVTLPLKIIVTGMMITWDLLDYPFSVRGWRVPMRANWVKNNFGASFGFGVSLAILFIIPCLQLLLLPVGTAGATWLVYQLEDHPRLPRKH